MDYAIDPELDGVRLDAITWHDMLRTIRPDLTDAEIDQGWREFQEWCARKSLN